MESDVTVFSVAKDGFMHIISSFKIFGVSLKHAIVKGCSVKNWSATYFSELFFLGQALSGRIDY